MISSFIVYLGPSLSHDEARGIQHADYRPPIVRGDLAQVPGDACVAIVDGEFAQNLAVTPLEIQQALMRGVTILGAASMGALRAAEVPGVLGVGRIHKMFCDGELTRDDEVALIYDPKTYRNVTVPLVNVRHSVARLLRTGTISPRIAQRLLAAAKRIHFTERDYARILDEAELGRLEDANDLLASLRLHDLKREDTCLLLESLPALAKQARRARDEACVIYARSGGPGTLTPPISAESAQQHEPSDAPLFIWESGDQVGFSALLDFLKLNGTFAHYQRDVFAHWHLSGNVRSMSAAAGDPDAIAARARAAWGWFDSEEVRVSLKDLGIGLADLDEFLHAEGRARSHQTTDEHFLRTLRHLIWLDQAALKAHVMRLGAIEWLAKRGQGRPEDHDAVLRTVCVKLRIWDANQAKAELGRLGVSLDWLTRLADARAAAASPPVRSTPVNIRAIPSSKKLKGEARFSMPFAKASALGRRFAKSMQVTRVGHIGEMADMGVFIAQAFRPTGRFSSTVGGGKGTTARAAEVGAIMEEAEKFAQERFDRTVQAEVVATHAELRGKAIAPSAFDLPFDTSYAAKTKIPWIRALDLVSGKRILIPLAAATCARTMSDPFVSARLGRKCAGTSGLAAGFTLGEAVTHALCELIERDATKLSELKWNLQNVLGPPREAFLAHSSLPRGLQQLIEKVTRRGGLTVRVLDITSDIAVPTFHARVLDDFMQPLRWSEGITVNDGYGAHPDPATAVRMAILEAAQTLAGIISTSRDDLSVQARSLGRHERPRMQPVDAVAGWYSTSSQDKSFADVRGFSSQDTRRDVHWLVEKVRAAGLGHVILIELPCPELAPARVVRVLVPGIETNNPFHTGLRARRLLLSDWI